ncbi:probable G-protein coupled receptor Mth-like 1 [Diaphorina citri]|uniref:Probable G-protein coupled receptor Mth-like 1 n=1 Tax=Diaphorina citri TaxID=121845 RepID=A0A1S4EHC1_DIACI|nr:probable G-protein coupled receptor Mth-like 1 [Diaphorina citri]
MAESMNYLYYVWTLDSVVDKIIRARKFGDLWIRTHAHFNKFDNGSLYLNEQEHELISNKHYCIENNAALVCVRESSDVDGDVRKGKIFKCCGDNAVYSETNKSCIIDTNSEYWTLGNNFTIIGGFPACVNNNYAVHGKLDDTYSLNIDGTLLNSNGKIYNQSYCIEKVYENLSEKASIFVCANSYAAFEKDIRFSIYPIGLAISIVFLILTLLSTLLLPCTYHVLHWRCQINYIICLLFADALLCISQLFTSYITSTFCVLLGKSSKFLLISFVIIKYLIRTNQTLYLANQL